MTGKVALISAALRFPGARDLDSYWANLLAGRDSITRCQDAVPHRERPSFGQGGAARYVPAYGNIEEPSAFDPIRFGMTAVEALSTDPQQRVLLELVDEALHRAALPSSQRSGAAVFVGTGLNDYASAVRRHMTTTIGIDDMAVELGTARDYVAGKIAYRLDLHGPAVNVLSACSTGLLAVHLSCRSLLAGECDVAVAGASAIRFPEGRGYWALPGSISSFDGVCRPFDARAGGTVPADGAGVVVLKRLADALASGDQILAVIRGSAANNDGHKVGFANVSACAQERVITAALRAAEIEAGAVRYVESHGAATRLGDAVEWSSLRQVFGHNDAPVQVGAVKGNLGHTREAAGLAGLLKAVLCLRHRLVPPTANFESLPNDLFVANSPVRPVGTSVPLDLESGHVAVGVSAFGLGGTNCHVVLEAAPPSPAPHTGRQGVILLSSHSKETLQTETEALRSMIEQRPDAVSRIAGRSQLRHQSNGWRRYLSLGREETLAEAFSVGLVDRRSRLVPRRAARMAFAFPGIGSQFVGMGAGLAARYETFRRSRDDIVAMARACGIDIAGAFDVLPAQSAKGGLDLKRMLGRTAPAAHACSLFDDVAVGHLSLFAVQMALVDLLAEAGLRPSAVVGHSLGEWSAATVAGSLARQDAVRLIALRAKLIEQAPEGATLAVAADADTIASFLVAETVLAADNSPQSCAVSGSSCAVEALELRLRAEGFVFRRLASRAAFHTPHLLEASRALRRAVEAQALSDPALRMMSSVTGRWIEPGEFNGTYWEAQLTEPVHFRRALGALAAAYDVVVEIGPGSIRSWVLQLGTNLEPIRTSPMSYETLDEGLVYEEALAELWLRGHEPIWPARDAKDRCAIDFPPPALRRSVFDLSSVDPDPMAHSSAADPAPPALVAEGALTEPAENGEHGVSPTFDQVFGLMAKLWQALLGYGTLSPDDDFFAIGGDSLLGRHLIASVADLYGVEIPPAIIFSSTSLRGMATSVHQWISSEGASHVERCH